MINEASKKDLLWGYLAQFLNIGSGIIIIPVAIKYLSVEDMGLWYLFIAIVGLAQLLEFGLQPTISRLTSYIYSGAKELKAEGIPSQGGAFDHQLLFDLIHAAKIMYRYVSVGAALILLIVGTAYLNTFEEFRHEQALAWLIFSISSIINFYFTYFNGLITGRGEQQELYRITAISKLVMLAVSIPLLINQVGLLSMAIAAFISMVSARIMLYRVFYNCARKEIEIIKNIKNISSSYLKTLWLSAWKLGVTSLGAFLILRANLFIASSFFGLAVAASYGLTVQLILILSSVSSMIFKLNLPKLNALQNIDDKAGLRRIFFRSLAVTHILYFSGALFIVLIGIPLLDLISSNTKLVSVPVLIMMLLMYQLELNHSVCATYLTTLNKVPFVYASLISGGFIVCISLFLSANTALGVIGLILSQFIIQLIYNNWYWPMVTYRDLMNES